MKNGNCEKIDFDVQAGTVWVSAYMVQGDSKYRIPAPLKLEEVEAIYKIFKKL